jgi:hypothetical protein
MWRFPGRRESDVGNYFTLDLTDTERKVNGDYSISNSGTERGIIANVVNVLLTRS